MCDTFADAAAPASTSDEAAGSALDAELQRRDEDGDSDSDDFSVSSMSSDTHLSQYMSEDDDDMEPSDVCAGCECVMCVYACLLVCFPVQLMLRSLRADCRGVRQSSHAQHSRGCVSRNEAART